jgi:hypothetical protein
MRLGIATDHGGFGLKEQLAARFTGVPRHLRRLGKVAALEAGRVLITGARLCEPPERSLPFTGCGSQTRAPQSQMRTPPEIFSS